MVILDRFLALERLLGQALMLLDELIDVADADTELDEVNGHISRERDAWLVGRWSTNEVEQIPWSDGDVQTSCYASGFCVGCRLHAGTDRPHTRGIRL
jgi:hypothetical protein